jgi:hypothetical protein
MTYYFIRDAARIRTKRGAIEEVICMQETLKLQYSDHVREIDLLKEKHRADVMGYQAKINCMERAHTEEIERIKSEYQAAGKISELAYEIIHELRKEDK